MDLPVLGSGSGAELRVRPGPDGPAGLVLRVAGRAALTSALPARITVLDRGGTRELPAGYGDARLHSNRLVCTAALAVAGAQFRVHDVFAWSGPGLRLRRRVSVHLPGGRGPRPAGFASAFRWTVEPGGTGEPPEWFLPGCVYGRNDQAPGYAIGARLGDGPVLVREDRLGLPVAARYDRERGQVLALIHEAPSGGTVTADDSARVLVSGRLGFGSFGDLSAGELGFTFPGSEGPVSYPPMWTSGIGNSQADSPVSPFPPMAAAAGMPRDWAVRYHPVTEGFTHEYELVTAVTDAASFPRAVRAAWRMAWDLQRPRVRLADLAAAERASLDLLAASVTRDDGAAEGRADGTGRPPLGIPTWVDVFTGAPGRLQDTFSTGFVGRNLEVGYVLLRASERHGRPGWAALASELIGFWVTEAGGAGSPGRDGPGSGADGGLCHTEWDRAQRSWLDAGRKGVVYLRDQSEARTAVLAAADWLRARSAGRPDWLNWCLAYGRWLAAHTGRDGALCRSYHLDGTPSDTSVNDGIHAAGYLARLAAVTGDRAHADLAERIAEFYWAAYHSEGIFAGGTLDNPNCCDREAASLAMDAYLAVHRATGRRRWLDAAVTAADYCESWIVGWDVPMHASDADRQPFFDRDAWAAGLALITLGFSAVDTYLARHVGDFGRLAALTGDRHYRAVAGLLLHNTKQMIQRSREYGYAAPGFQIEHWSIGRGRGYGLNSGWLPWVSTSHVLGIWDAEELDLTGLRARRKRMPLVEFGTTGMAVSRVGLGTWAFGGSSDGWRYGWGDQDDGSSVATIRAAVEAGMNWIDTAAVYGRGHAESVVGRALREMPDADRPYVFTKAGRQWQEDDLSAPLRSVLTPATIRADVEGSLRRLGVERLDLLQLHWPATDGTPVEEYWPVLADLREEGKIRAAGLSNHWLAQLGAAQAVARVDSVQLPLSLLKPEAARAETLWCQEHDAGFLAYSPLASGLLSGHMSRERMGRLAPEDWRRASPDFTGDRLESNLRAGERLGRLAAERGVSPSTLAIAWVLACPGVSGAIVGARRPDQLSDWLPALEYTLPDAEARQIAAEVRP